jgi:hypothetical protein
MEVDPENPWHNHRSSVGETSESDHVDQRDEGQRHGSHETQVNPEAPLEAKELICFAFRESNVHWPSMKNILIFQEHSQR